MAVDTTVVYRGRRATLTAQGVRHGGIVAFRWGFEHDGRHREQVSFVLVDEAFLIAQPVVFTGGQVGWWYCDLLEVQDEGTTVRITDLYVDVIVGPPDRPYRVLDLDELAQAVTDGDVPAATALRGLQRCQDFLDRRLNRRYETTPTWPDFPPEAVTGIDVDALPRSWSWSGPKRPSAAP